MPLVAPFQDANPKRTVIRNLYHADETQCVSYLLENIELTLAQSKSIEKQATELVRQIRQKNESHGGLDAFLQEFKLSSMEGVALMCLAEALLRVPDAETADQLIQDKLSDADWASHLGKNESFFVNASTWGLMLTGKVMSLDKVVVKDAGDYVGRLIARSGEPVIRTAVKQAMKIMGKQFVLAESIERGLKAAEEKERQGYDYSFDMLGEAARTEIDAQHYMAAYENAIAAIGARHKKANPYTGAGISVKLSALHPRYEFQKGQRVVKELYPRLKALCLQACELDIGLTIDAEEAERLEPSLSLLQMLCDESALKQWNGLGFVVQAYQKRAPAVIDWIEQVADKSNRKIMIRLVKGAYWDSEIKQSQVEGYADYPVYTRKISTDVSYLVCAQKLLKNNKVFYPLFATHNAHTVASILNFAGDRKDYEFQCLHGMGEILYDHVVTQLGVNCRIYAPVGPHKNLLAYLVRRLLENGANSSFVNRLVDKKMPIESIVANPVKTLDDLEHKSHPHIPLPARILGNRVNSAGMNLNNNLEVEPYFTQSRKFINQNWKVHSLIANISESNGSVQSCFSPNSGSVIGQVTNASSDELDLAVSNAKTAFDAWDKCGGTARAEVLNAAADCYEKHRDELMTLCMVEAGKTMQDAIAEVREAVDFLRYYGDQAATEFNQPETLTGPTGELNQLSLHGRGTFVCISPWNFPLAIFTGQLSAALAAGNSVLAKPAEQTPIIAYRSVQMLYQSGVPEDVLQLIMGDGVSVGSALVAHPDIHGVTFTGSTKTAKLIQQALAEKPGPIVPLIAETGGINAMIVDSTALPEQVVQDAIQSAFQSAGQRCSALRVLYLQDDVADDMIDMLKGAMLELKVGNTLEMDTDIGPIIDHPARQNLQNHINKYQDLGANISITPDPQEANEGYFLSPALIEIKSITELQSEIFGPILHICRYAASDLDKVVDDINSMGYGLTFGVHSRIQTTIERITNRINVGNIYVNRNTIGAVVGVQPFGGEGLSGTGPKAGGPHYLHRFAVERSISTDTTAAGGNTSLLSLEYL